MDFFLVKIKRPTIYLEYIKKKNNNDYKYETNEWNCETENNNMKIEESLLQHLPTYIISAKNNDQAFLVFFYNDRCTY